MEAVGNTDEGDGASAEFGVGNAELKCITHRNRFEISYPFHPLHLCSSVFSTRSPVS